jgi:hypothetical protein
VLGKARSGEYETRVTKPRPRTLLRKSEKLWPVTLWSRPKKDLQKPFLSFKRPLPKVSFTKIRLLDKFPA